MRWLSYSSQLKLIIFSEELLDGEVEHHEFLNKSKWEVDGVMTGMTGIPSG